MLGGFLGALFAVAPEHLAGLLASQPLAASGELVSVVRSELGANRLMIGAAELVFEPVLAEPSSFVDRRTAAR